MQKLLNYVARGVQVMLFAICAFFVASQLVHAVEFSSLRDVIASVKEGSGAAHSIQFIVANQVSTSTISIDFSQVVSSTSAIDYRQVRLLYGPSSGEVEYPVAASAGDGIWGASVDAGTKRVTLDYPTAHGVPIAAGNSVTVNVGTNPTPVFPQAATSSLALPTLNINQFQIAQPEIIVRESVPNSPQDSPQNIQNPNPSENAPSQISVDFLKARQLILETLSRIRSVITQSGGGSVIAPTQTNSQVATSTPVQQQNQQTTQSQPQASDAQQQVIVLPSEKASDVSPSQETTLSVRRDDGGGLDVLLPQQQTLSQGADARASGEREGSLGDSYTINVKPVTLDQAKTWTSLEVPDGISIAPAQSYIVTAYQQKDGGATAIQNFLNPVKYVFRFTEEEIQGIDKQQLSGYSWNGSALQKELSTIDLNVNTITVSANHLTLFMIGGPKTSARSIVSVQSSVSLVPVKSDVGLTDFGITKDGEKSPLYQSGRDISVTPNTKLSLCIPLGVFKKYPKNISLSLVSASAILSFDPVKQCYGATILTPSESGTRQLTLRIVYIDDQVQTSSFRVSVLPDFQVKLISLVGPNIDAIKKNVEVANAQVEQTITQSQPALQTTAIVVGPAAAALNPGLISNSINWYHYLNHFISALLSALGLRKRRRPWGVVYDGITKNPVDLAIVRLFEMPGKKLIETQVTDKAGRFSFLVKPGTYTISVIKQPYIYPSSIVKGGLDGDYQHVYHEEQFILKKDEDIIELSIPLDPPHPDLVKQQETFVHVFSRFFSKYSSVSLFVSMAISILLAYYAPTFLNLALLFLNSIFVITRAMRLSGREKPWGMVFDAQSFAPIPLAAIGIIAAKEGKLLRTRLSDYEGRFGFLAPQGEYLFTVAKEQYQFPPSHPPHSRKHHAVYMGGKVVIKKNKGYVKLDIPMEKTLIAKKVKV